MRTNPFCEQALAGPPRGKIQRKIFNTTGGAMNISKS